VASSLVPFFRMALLLSSQTLNPRRFAVQSSAEIQSRVVDGQVPCGRPELQLIAESAAFTAVKSTRLEVDGKAPTTLLCGNVQWTGTIKLIATAVGGDEA
jgi:hypothetical protein